MQTGNFFLDLVQTARLGHTVHLQALYGGEAMSKAEVFYQVRQKAIISTRN